MGLLHQQRLQGRKKTRVGIIGEVAQGEEKNGTPVLRGSGAIGIGIGHSSAIQVSV